MVIIFLFARMCTLRIRNILIDMDCCFNPWRDLKRAEVIAKLLLQESLRQLPQNAMSRRLIIQLSASISYEVGSQRPHCWRNQLRGKTSVFLLLGFAHEICVPELLWRNKKAGLSLNDLPTYWTLSTHLRNRGKKWMMSQWKKGGGVKFANITIAG